MVQKTDKIYALESLRGVASFIVMLHHFFIVFFPAIFVGTMAVSHSKFEWILAETPLRAFINGGFAVTVFFVLSGFVLSYGFFKRGGDLIAASIKRYFRLMPIVLVSVIIAFTIYVLNRFYHLQMGHLTGTEYLLELWPSGQHLTLFSALYEGLIGVFVTPSGANSLNPVLWTIYYELIGSLIVYSLLALVKNDKRRVWVYIIAVVVLVATQFVGFVVGLIIADLYVNRRDIMERIIQTKIIYKVIALGLVVYMASFNTPHGSYAPLELTGNPSLNLAILYTLSSALLIILLLTSRRLNGLLTLKPFIVLGRLSYSLYAVHFIVLGSVGTYSFLRFQQFLPYNRAALAAFGVYIVATFAIATLLTKYVDEPSLKFSRYIGQKLKR